MKVSFIQNSEGALQSRYTSLVASYKDALAKAKDMALAAQKSNRVGDAAAAAQQLAQARAFYAKGWQDARAAVRTRLALEAHRYEKAGAAIAAASKAAGNHAHASRAAAIASAVAAKASYVRMPPMLTEQAFYLASKATDKAVAGLGALGAGPSTNPLVDSVAAALTQAATALEQQADKSGADVDPIMKQAACEQAQKSAPAAKSNLPGPPVLNVTGRKGLGRLSEISWSSFEAQAEQQFGQTAEDVVNKAAAGLCPPTPPAKKAPGATPSIAVGPSKPSVLVAVGGAVLVALKYYAII